MPETTPADDVPEVTLFLAFLVLLLIIFGVFAWIILCKSVFGLHSFFAGFLFFWYWAIVEKAKFGRLLPTLAGVIAGIAVAWQLSFLAKHFGASGAIAGLAVIFAVQFVDLMRWLPQVLNPATFLFVIVLTIPSMLTSTYFPEVFAAAGFGAAFSAILVYAALRAFPNVQKPRPALAREAGE